MINKITAPIGTIARILTIDETSWIYSGWSFIRQDGIGYSLLRKIK